MMHQRISVDKGSFTILCFASYHPGNFPIHYDKSKQLYTQHKETIEFP